MADNAVSIETVAGSVSQIDLSVWSLIGQADIVVKMVMLLLVFASIWSWAIIFDKWRSFRSNSYKSDKFEKAYRSSKSPKSLYEKINTGTENALTAMFVASMQEFNDGVMKGVSRATPDIINACRERILVHTQRIKHEYLTKMESKLIFLATVGSASPFIGLFGTVWGIVHSFQSIAQTKNTSLAVVAPGIAEALLATAMGLVAAIPAVIFYNMFSNEIRKFSGKLDDFAGELATLVPYFGGK